MYKAYLGNCVRTMLIGVSLLLICAHCFAQQSLLEDPPLSEKKSEVEVLKDARSLRSSDENESEQRAYEALKLAQENNNKSVEARAHSLLARLGVSSNDVSQSSHHFQQAIELYSVLGDARNRVSDAIEFAEFLYAQDNFSDAHAIIDEILPVAEQQGNDSLLARILMLQGSAYFERARYQDSIESYLSAVNYLNSQDELTLRRLGSAFHQLGQAHKKLKNRDETVLFHKKSLDVHISLQDQGLIARSFKNVAIAEHQRGNNLDALDYVFRSAEIHEQLNDVEEHADVLMLGGMLYRNLERYEKAIEYLYQAYEMYREMGNMARVAVASIQIGFLYTRLKKFDQARSFYQLPIDLSPSEVESETLASAYREIAVIEFEAKNYDAAMELAKKAHSIYQETGSKSKGCISARHIGNIYLAKGETDKAVAYYRESLLLATESNNFKVKVRTLNSLGRALLKSDTEEAIPLLEEALKISKKKRMASQEKSAHKSLKNAYKSMGNTKKALWHAEKAGDLSDRIYKDREKNKLVLAKARLDSHKMEMELESLRKEIQVDKLQLAQKNNEIEIVRQARQISELELSKKRYANMLLGVLLAICVSVAIYTFKVIFVSRKRNEELDYLATHDSLTNCYNRRALFDLMSKAFADPDNLNEYSIIMADVDNFKEVNDTYGHGVGDSVLCGIANVLQNCIRQSDIVARYGGEEFCVVLPGATLEQALNIAKAMRMKVEKASFSEVSVTCSLGVSSIKFEATNPSELITQADMALYQSKQNGRNQVTSWNPYVDAS